MISIKDELIKFQENNLKDADEEIKALFNNTVNAIVNNSDGNDEDDIESIFYIMLLQCQMYATLINNISLFGSKDLIDRCRNAIKSLTEDMKD